MEKRNVFWGWFWCALGVFATLIFLRDAFNGNVSDPLVRFTYVVLHFVAATAQFEIAELKGRIK